MRLLARAALAASLALGACGYGNSVVQAFWQSGPANAAAPRVVDAAPTAPAAAAPAQPPAATAAAKPAPLPPAPSAETRKPFVVIRFEGAAPDYVAPLYDAMEGALAREPDVAFDLVAVTDDAGAAERNLANVLDTMTGMGMPASRITLSAAAPEDARTDEVWIYVR